jgi:hypothetical protein
MIYQNIAKMQMCKHLQNHLFTLFSFHNSAKHANFLFMKWECIKVLKESSYIKKKNMYLEFSSKK